MQVRGAEIEGGHGSDHDVERANQSRDLHARGLILGSDCSTSELSTQVKLPGDHFSSQHLMDIGKHLGQALSIFANLKDSFAMSVPPLANPVSRTVRSHPIFKQTLAERALKTVESAAKKAESSGVGGRGGNLTAIEKEIYMELTSHKERLYGRKKARRS
jgi:hypothetical protein